MDIVRLIGPLTAIINAVLDEDPNVDDNELATQLDDALDLKGLAEALDGPIIVALIKVARFAKGKIRTKKAR